MSERIENMRTAIETMHKCKAIHEQSYGTQRVMHVNQTVGLLCTI